MSDHSRARKMRQEIVSRRRLDLGPDDEDNE